MSQSKHIKMLVRISLLAALATILMFLELPPFFPAAPFLKLDFSDVPAAIATLIGGIPAGVSVQLVKNLINALTTKTVGVGELANFIVGVALILPFGLFHKLPTRLSHILRMIIVGLLATVSIMLAGWISNRFVMLPVYAAAFQTPLDILLKSLPIITLFNAIKGLTLTVLMCLLPPRLLAWMKT